MYNQCIQLFYNYSICFIIILKSIIHVATLHGVRYSLYNVLLVYTHCNPPLIYPSVDCTHVHACYNFFYTQ